MKDGRDPRIEYPSDFDKENSEWKKEYHEMVKKGYEYDGGSYRFLPHSGTWNEMKKKAICRKHGYIFNPLKGSYVLCSSMKYSSNLNRSKMKDLRPWML